MMNTTLIDAIIAMYGMTKTEAKKYARTCDDAMKNELIKAYRDNARNFNSHARVGRDPIYCVYRITRHNRWTYIYKTHWLCSYFINNQAFLSVEPNGKRILSGVRILNYQHSLRVICFLCSKMFNTSMPIISKIIYS